MRLFVLFSLIITSAFLSISCSKSSSTTSSAGGSSTNLTLAYPVGMAVASPTAATTPDIYPKVETLDATTADDSYSDKVEALNTILNGTSISDCDFNLALSTTTTNAACYGPEIDFTGHPDYVSGPGSANGSLPPGDMGIWTANSGATTEACAAAQMNSKVANIAGQVDSMMATVASVFCIAKVNNLTLPEAGSSLTLTNEVNTAYSTNQIGATVTSAIIARAADTAEGNKAYTTSLGLTISAGTADEKIVTLRLKHIPTAADNTTYKGKLSYKIAMATKSPGMMWCDSSIAAQTDAASIAYEKTAATSVKYQLHSGNFSGNNTQVDPYTSATNFTVDRSKSVAGSGVSYGWANNFYYALFNMNPVNGTGNFQFAWQAGMPDKATRVLNISLADTAGTVSGCSYYGYGPDMATGSNLGAINKFYCNWAGPAGAAFEPDPTLKAAKGVSKAQKQCLSKSSSATTFTSTSTAITYAPTLSCNSSGSLAYGLKGGALSATPVTNDLVNISSISDITAPTAPTDVDL